ncbi:MAG: hypothetical protein Q9159_003197 [Coniocarpon cinnabarinum]
MAGEGSEKARGLRVAHRDDAILQLGGTHKLRLVLDHSQPALLRTRFHFSAGRTIPVASPPLAVGGPVCRTCSPPPVASVAGVLGLRPTSEAAWLGRNAAVWTPKYEIHYHNTGRLFQDTMRVSEGAVNPDRLYWQQQKLGRLPLWSSRGLQFVSAAPGYDKRGYVSSPSNCVI